MFNLDHERALSAFNMVDSIGKLTCKEKDKDKAVYLENMTVVGAAQGDANATKQRFLQEVRATPVLIHQSGLLQTLAFYDAKAQARRLVRLCILHWLRCYNEPRAKAREFTRDAPDHANKFYKQLLEAAGNETDLRSMTAEAQAFLVWLKNFAETQFARLGKE